MFMSGVAAHGLIDEAANEYMDALAQFRIEIFSAELLTLSAARGAGHISDRAA